MKKLEVIIQPFLLDEVMQALNHIGIESMTISNVRGDGLGKGHKQAYRGQTYVVPLLARIKIEVIVPDEQSEDVVKAVRGAARDANIDDGKIFISEVTDVVRIRTGHRGEFALFQELRFSS